MYNERCTNESMKESNQVTVLSQKCNRNLLTKLMEKIEMYRKKLKKSEDTIRKLKKKKTTRICI